MEVKIMTAIASAGDAWGFYPQAEMKNVLKHVKEAECDSEITSTDHRSNF